MDLRAPEFEKVRWRQNYAADQGEGVKEEEQMVNLVLKCPWPFLSS